MSENTNITENPVSAQGAKGKIKKILPVVAVVVVLLVIITSCFGGGSGKSVNKESTKLMYKSNSKKILAMVPKDYEDAIMEHYGDYVKDKKQLREAIEQERALSMSGIEKVKKIKFKESFKIDLNNLSDSELNSTDKALIETMYSHIEEVWKEIKNCDEGYVTLVEVTIIDVNGNKDTIETVACSFKYKGKWYPMNAMDVVDSSAWICVNQ